MNRRFLALTALLASLTFAAAEQKFDPKADPVEDVAKASVEARRTGKRILLDVGGEWCSWCHLMDKFIATTPEIQKLVEAKYVVVKVNFSEENKNEKFLSQFPKIDGYPHLFVLDESGKLLHSQSTGELEQGKGYNTEKFKAFLQKWAK